MNKPIENFGNQLEIPDLQFQQVSQIDKISSFNPLPKSFFYPSYD
jgi:hypothetical protein